MKHPQKLILRIKKSLMRKILSLLILFCFLIPLMVDSLPKTKGRTYAPEEGTFDRRKRIVIQLLALLDVPFGSVSRCFW